MKTILYNALFAFILLLFPVMIFGQAPSLGSAFRFALFSAAGAFSNDGLTVVKGTTSPRTYAIPNNVELDCGILTTREFQ